jgi:hypothetical protein
VIEVWEPQEALDTWIRDTIAPMMQGAGGSAPPAQTAPVHHMILR